MKVYFKKYTYSLDGESWSQIREGLEILRNSLQSILLGAYEVELPGRLAGFADRDINIELLEIGTDLVEFTVGARIDTIIEDVPASDVIKVIVRRNKVELSETTRSLLDNIVLEVTNDSP